MSRTNAPPPAGLVLVLRPEWIGGTGLFRVESGRAPEAVDAEEVGLSEGLADRLEDWTDSFDALFDDAAPETSRFHSREAYALFVEEAQVLAGLIRRETGAEVRIDIPAQVRPEDA